MSFVAASPAGLRAIENVVCKSNRRNDSIQFGSIAIDACVLLKESSNPNIICFSKTDTFPSTYIFSIYRSPALLNDDKKIDIKLIMLSISLRIIRRTFMILEHSQSSYK